MSLCPFPFPTCGLVAILYGMATCLPSVATFQAHSQTSQKKRGDHSWICNSDSRDFSINRFFCTLYARMIRTSARKKRWHSHVTVYLITVIVARPGYAYCWSYTHTYTRQVQLVWQKVQYWTVITTRWLYAFLVLGCNWCCSKIAGWVQYLFFKKIWIHPMLPNICCMLLVIATRQTQYFLAGDNNKVRDTHHGIQL